MYVRMKSASRQWCRVSLVGQLTIIAQLGQLAVMLVPIHGRVGLKGHVGLSGGRASSMSWSSGVVVDH